MTDRFDRAATMNFVTVAQLRGPLQAATLQRALRCLEARHPLLRAQLVRGPEYTSLSAGAAEIPLFEREVEQAQVLALGGALLEHREWPDSGPRAELHWLRHGPDSSSLLLLLHHVVSDGSSGILAMRDLLAFAADGDPSAVQPLPSPGQDSFFPAEQKLLRDGFLAQLKAGVPKALPVARVGSRREVPMEERSMGVLRLQLDAAQSTALQQRARHDGATIHGVLSAALALAIAQEVPEPGLQRMAHPVDLRRYLRARYPDTSAIGDAVGYYVSSVVTEHTLHGQPLGSLAREISAAVRAGKESGEPLLNAPVRGPLLVDRTAGMPVAEFRTLCEQQIFDNTCSLTNLGKLEQLGCAEHVGALQVEDLYFLAASSVLGKFGGSAVSFRGRIALQLAYVRPFVPDPLAETLLRSAHVLMLNYLG